MHAQQSFWAKGVKFGLSFHLCPYFMYASSEDSGET